MITDVYLRMSCACPIDGALDSFVFFFVRYGHPRDLHSFPTRRSSDLSRFRVVPPGIAPRSAIWRAWGDRKSTRLNSSHLGISYAVFCLKKKSGIGSETRTRARLSWIRSTPPHPSGTRRYRCHPILFIL